MEEIIKNISESALLVDILSNSSFEKGYIKGIENLSAYEVGFLDKI